MRRLAVLAIASLSALAIIPVTAGAATLPPGFSETVIGGLTDPTAMAYLPDGRLLVAQQGGRLRVVANGQALSTPFVNLSVDSSGERGLIGVAVHPSFPSVNRIYVHYTVPAGGGRGAHNRVSWFPANGNVAGGGETVVLELPDLGATNHNGGAIHVGSDGHLHVAVGENAVASRAQDLSTPFGKLLRLTQDGGVPADNPFVGVGGADARIWAWGLRNPFTFAFQPGTGRLFINDVGGGAWEEINEGRAGANYGWPTTEGPTNDPRFVSPLHAYQTHVAGTCAIAGGTFFGDNYAFSDLCAGWIRLLNLTTGGITELASGIGAPVDLAVSLDWAPTYVARSGVVGRITGGPPLHAFLRNVPSTGVANLDFFYAATAGDVFLGCDWNGDGIDTIGVRRGGQFFLRNANSTGVADLVIGYGDPGDVAVCGDWNGDGTDTIGVRRGGGFFLRNSNSTGIADLVIGYGDPGDRPVIGDWDGVGADGVGVWRPGVFLLRNTLSSGVAQVVVPYGGGSDVPVAGDWDADGRDGIGVWRPGAFFLRNTLTAGVAEVVAGYGNPSDRPLAGDWDGVGADGIGVVR